MHHNLQARRSSILQPSGKIWRDRSFPWSNAVHDGRIVALFCFQPSLLARVNHYSSWVLGELKARVTFVLGDPLIKRHRRRHREHRDLQLESTDWKTQQGSYLVQLHFQFCLHRGFSIYGQAGGGLLSFKTWQSVPCCHTTEEFKLWQTSLKNGTNPGQPWHWRAEATSWRVTCRNVPTDQRHIMKRTLIRSSSTRRRWIL